MTTAQLVTLVVAIFASSLSTAGLVAKILGDQIKQLGDQLGARMGSLENRMGQLESRMAAQEGALRDMAKQSVQLARIDDRVSALERAAPSAG